MQANPGMGFILCKVSAASTSASAVCPCRELSGHTCGFTAGWQGRKQLPGLSVLVRCVQGFQQYGGSRGERDRHCPLFLSAPQYLRVWSHTDSVLQMLRGVSAIMLVSRLFWWFHRWRATCFLLFLVYFSHICIPARPLLLPTLLQGIYCYLSHLSNTS